MRMVAVNVEYQKEGIYAIGITNNGSIKGKWCAKEKPVSGQTYFVELNLGTIDRSEVSVFGCDQFYSKAFLFEQSVQFTGRCEEIDEVYVIRFDTDWIEMISIENDDFLIRKGDTVSFTLSCDRIEIYPYEL